MDDSNSRSYVGYMLFLVILIIGLVLFMYSGQIASFWNSRNTLSTPYPLITNKLDMFQDYSMKITVGELTGNGLKSVATGHAITIKCDLHMLNASSNDGWASSYSTLKPIIKIGESPYLYYNPKDSVLVLVVKYMDNPYYPHFERIEVDFPLQKWTSVIATISNRAVRIYLDGTIVKYVELNNVAVISNLYSDVISVGEINNNIQGSIRNLSITFTDTNGS